MHILILFTESTFSLGCRIILFLQFLWSVKFLVSNIIKWPFLLSSCGQQLSSNYIIEQESGNTEVQRPGGLEYSLEFIYFSSWPFPLITLTCNDSQHCAPVAGEHIPGREVLVGPPALGVGLHVEHGEHAPVGQVDDAAHTRPGAGPRPRPGGGYRGF